MFFRLIFLLLVDALLALAGLHSAVVLRFGYNQAIERFSDSSEILISSVFVVAAIFSSQLMDVYDFSKITRKREVFINILMGASSTFFMLSIVYYLNPNVMLGRGVLFLSLCLFAIFQLLSHSLYLINYKHPRFSKKALVLGTGPLAAQIGTIASSHKHNYTLAGYASSNSNGTSANEYGQSNLAVPPDEIIGNAEDLLATTIKAQADVIVIALSERRGTFPLGEVLRCKMNGIEVVDAPSFYEQILAKLMLENMTPSWIIFSSGFNKSNLFSLLKRGMDIVLSLVGLVLAAPIAPLIALAIKLDSPGPVLFKQVRVGNMEKLFTLYKFRTMRQDAEAQTGAVWSEKNDPRVTRLGLVLRNTRIDEIPQLFNVLKGEMSFIGPRPERPEFVEKLKQVIPFYSKRHFIKPGLTGWAQVRYPYGSSVEDAIEKLRYDLYYLKNISPFLDLLIFFETIKVVLFGRGGR